MRNISCEQGERVTHRGIASSCSPLSVEIQRQLVEGINGSRKEYLDENPFGQVRQDNDASHAIEAPPVLHRAVTERIIFTASE